MDTLCSMEPLGQKSPTFLCQGRLIGNALDFVSHEWSMATTRLCHQSLAWLCFHILMTHVLRSPSSPPPPFLSSLPPSLHPSIPPPLPAVDGTLGTLSPASQSSAFKASCWSFEKQLHLKLLTS